MLRKSLIGGIIAVLFAMILLSSMPPALARAPPSIKVNVHARAEGNDIIVIGKAFLNDSENNGKVIVVIEITVKKPDGSTEEAEFEISGSGDGKGVIILPYEHIFEGCVKEKGIYEILVTATFKELMDTAFFKFDPPTGGTPGVPC